MNKITCAGDEADIMHCPADFNTTCLEPNIVGLRCGEPDLDIPISLCLP